jgi:hypothetical protein
VGGCGPVVGGSYWEAMSLLSPCALSLGRMSLLVFSYRFLSYGQDNGHCVLRARYIYI